MSRNTYDLVIIGLGAMGSFALRQAAKRGLKVLGIERFSEVPHNRGSHHGFTRIIRQAYFEDPSYVPLVLRAYELWSELEEMSNQTLMVRTGGLTMGSPTDEMVVGAFNAARIHHLPYEQLTKQEVSARFPGFRLNDTDVAIYEPNAGYLLSDVATKTALESAVAAGAEVWFSTEVTGYRANDHGVEVYTSRGSVGADKCILTVGAWAPEQAPDISFQVERQVCFWFEPKKPHTLANAPVFLSGWDDIAIYGFPYIDAHGLKIAFHHGGDTTTADTINRDVSSQEIRAMQSVAAELLPDLAEATLVKSSVCMYTNTRDYHFVIGNHPTTPNVVVGLGFSGHGFKFAPSIGELLVALAREEKGVVVPEIFNPKRLIGTQ